MRKGSFTIEAALLMPLVCTVLVLVLYLCAHVHNRAFLQARAYEEAIMESDLVSPQLFGAQGLTHKSLYGEDENQITFQANTKAVWGGWNWPLEVTGTFKKADPVAFIRKCQIGKLAIEGLKGAGT